MREICSFNVDVLSNRKAQNLYFIDKYQKSCRDFYRPQTKFAKVMFLHLSISHSVHRVGGCLGPGPGGGWGSGRGVSRPRPRRKVGDSGRGGLDPDPGGRLGGLAGGVQAHTWGEGVVQAHTGGIQAHT